MVTHAILGYKRPMTTNQPDADFPTRGSLPVFVVVQTLRRLHPAAL